LNDLSRLVDYPTHMGKIPAAIELDRTRRDFFLTSLCGTFSQSMILFLKRHSKSLVIAAAVLVLYRQVLLDLVVEWYRNPDYNHGLLLPIVTFYLVWRQRERLAATPISPNNIGLLVMLTGLCFLFGGELGAEFFVTRISILIFVAGLIVFLLGTKHLRLVAFPLALFVLAIPLPAVIYYQLTFPLQLLASKMGASFLEVFRVPVLREGNLIILPSITLEVAEACSGIRSLFSLITLTILYAYFLDHHRLWQAILVTLSIPLALFCNGLRIMGTGVLTQYVDPRAAEGFFHTFSGWFLFVTALFFLFIMHRGLVLVRKSVGA
jgi:exosortase